MAVLPAPISADLFQEARKQGLRSVADLAALGKKRFALPRPISAYPSAPLTKAGKMRTAFTPTMRRILEKNSKQELFRLGISDFQREFGYSVCAKTWIGLLNEIVRRDNGFNEWDRIELYIEDSIDAAVNAALLKKAAQATQFQDLEDRLNSCKDIANLTDDESALVWQTALELYHAAPVDRIQAKRFRRELRQCVYDKVPGIVKNRATSDDVAGIAKNLAALDKAMRRDHAEWLANGKKPLDYNYKGRPRGPELSQETYDTIVAYSVLNCGGRASQAWREYVTGEIKGIQPNPELLQYYEVNPADKSRVPDKIRERVKHEIAAMEDIHHGERRYSLTSHLQLDYSKIASGDWWCSDDLTAPVYYYIPDGDWFKVIRGQVIVTIDLRSKRILGFALIPQENYDSIHIRNHFTSIADIWGPPKRGCVWELNIWKKSRLLQGDKDADLRAPHKAELGLRGICEFRFRHKPTGKPIENSFARIQDLMEGEPGYCGRMEMKEKFERFEKLRLAVNAERVSPEGKIFSFDQWMERLTELAEKYNRTAYGRATQLAGLSPDQAYEKYWDMLNPPIKLNAESRFLLATHQRDVKVNDNGAEFKIGGRKFVYKSRRLGELKGRNVILAFNPEDTSLAFFIDPDSEKAEIAERVNPLDPVDAGDELSEEMRKLNEFQAPIRERYKVLKAKFEPVFRTTILSPKVRAIGRAIEEGKEQIREQRQDRAETVNRVTTNARALGIPAPRAGADLDDSAEGQEMLKAIRARKQNRAASAESHP